jgi:uncharacterized protein YggE
VVGSASVSVEPDCARLSCGVQVTGSHAQDALRRSNEAITAILAAVEANGIDAADVRTNGPNLYPTETGYAGSNDVTVVVRRLDTLGSVIDAIAESAGPNLTMHGVGFSVSDPGRHLPAARVAALAAAHQIASELAEATGAALGEVVTINESSGYQSPVSVRADSTRMLKATPVEPGSQEIRVDINVTYRLTAPG